MANPDQRSSYSAANTPGIDWLGVANLPTGGTQADPYMQEAQRAADQLDRQEAAAKAMANYQAMMAQLGAPSQYAASRSQASQYVATPDFYGDAPEVTVAHAERTFGAMPRMPAKPLFGRRLASGEIAPDPYYAAAQDYARKAGFDPMGREAASLYGQSVDQFLASRYADALQARNITAQRAGTNTSIPVNAYGNYVDLSQIGYEQQPRTDNPRAMDMSQWFSGNRDEPGMVRHMNLPKSLMSRQEVPDIYARDPLTVNIMRKR